MTYGFFYLLIYRGIYKIALLIRHGVLPIRHTPLRFRHGLAHALQFPPSSLSQGYFHESGILKPRQGAGHRAWRTAAEFCEALVASPAGSAPPAEPVYETVHELGFVG